MPHRKSCGRLPLCSIGVALIAVACLLSSTAVPIAAPVVRADETEPAEAEAGPIGQFVTLTSPIDDGTYARVTGVVAALKTRCTQEKRRGVLVLEIPPGSSPFHQVQGLAKFLANEAGSLTTVAWVPQTVRGNHGVLALACQEIVMKRDAALGDLGVGKPLEPDEQTFVLNLVGRRHNSRLSEGLAIGMMDRSKDVIWVQVQKQGPAGDAVETRVVLPNEFERLLKSKAVIQKHETLKPAGVDGLFTGAKAIAYNILAMHVAESRDEVAKLYKLPREAMRERAGAGKGLKALHISLKDVVEPIIAEFIVREVRKAPGAGIQIVILEIDSPGGYLHSSQRIADALVEMKSHKVQTVAYVPKQALSGAAMAAMGCEQIVLHPDAVFGDAGPLEIKPGGAFERAPEKVLGVLREYMAALAKQHGRSPALASAMCDRQLEVFEVRHRDTGVVEYMTDDEIHATGDTYIKGRPVPESGHDRLLTVNGRRAHELKLAEPTVNDFNELKQRLGVSGENDIVVASKSWVDDLIFYLNTPVVTSGLLFMGIFLIFLELHFPTAIFAVGAVTCFALFFWSRFGGTADWLEVILFVLGAGFLAFEIFVTPGFGVFGFSGILMMLAALVLASQTFVIPASRADLEELGGSLAVVLGGLFGAIVLGAITSRYLPAIPLFEGMILTPPGRAADEPRLRPEFTRDKGDSLLEREPELVGQAGVSTTMLRPSGKARIGDQFVDVVSEGPFIETGRPIEVVQVEGARVVVREVTSS